MGISLDEYQSDAISRMKNGCILAGGTGSGKSLTALTYYFMQGGGQLNPYKPMKEPSKDLYIITTAKKRDSLEWEHELIPFSLSPDKSRNHAGNKIVIDSWNNIQKYSSVKDAFFIFDENKISTMGAWSKALIKIARGNLWIILSATPGDKWEDYMTVFIANGFYRNKSEFAWTHLVYDRYAKYPKVDRYLNTDALMKHRRDILVNMDYHSSAIQHHKDIFCEYNREDYKRVMQHWDIWKNKPYKTRAELCYGLRKVTNTYSERSDKVLELCEEHPKVIIFYNFDYELEILEHLQYGPHTKVAMWNGHKHDPVPDSARWVYLVQYNACEGWNCTKTDTMIFYSQNYSYKTMVQASGRIDRRNTPYKDLYYYHLKSFASIDVAITRALKNKKKFNEGQFIKDFKIIA